MLTIQKFLEGTHRWAADRSHRFRYLWPLKGGWEGWIQVDLMSHFFEADGTTDIQREQPIYVTARKRVDLLLNTDAMEDRRRIPVEIKAESFENMKKFISGVVKDMTKLQTERSSDYLDCECLMIALCFEQSDYNQLRAMKNPANRAIYSNVYLSSEIAVVSAELARDGTWKHR